MSLKQFFCEKASFVGGVGGGVCRRSKLIICEDNILLCVWGEGVVIQNPFLR